MRPLVATAACALCFSASALAGELTDPAPERVVFHTVAGDLVFALFPNAAPQTVAQFLRLVRAGVYDTTTFARLHPGFIAQVSTAQDRRRPLTAEQTALLRKLPLEASALRHARGVLSLAHPEGDPNGGESSFCILLGASPQLDDKYTIFGRLESSDAVLAELLRVPRGGDLQPSVRLTIERAEVFDTPLALGRATLTPAHPVAGAPLQAPDAALPREGVLSAGLLLVVLLAGASAALRSRLSPKLTASLNLVVLLVGAFLLIVLLLPEGQRHSWIGGLLFLGMIAVFRALGRFEPAAER